MTKIMNNMVQKQNFIDKIINKISEEIETNLSEELEYYCGETNLRIFINIDPKLLEIEEIYEAIDIEMHNRGFFVKEIEASSDRFPKTLIDFSLIKDGK